MHTYSDIFFLNKDTGFICGYDDFNSNDAIILKTEDGGNSWDTTRFTGGPWLMEIEFVTDSIGYTGGQDGYLYRTNNTGTTWLAIDDCAHTHDFSNMFWLNADTAILQGFGGDLKEYVYNRNPPCSLLQYTNAKNFFPGTGDMEFIDSTNAYMAGGWGGNFYKSVDRGYTWTSDSCCPSSLYVLCVKMHDLNNGIIGGNRGAIKITSDGGLTWSATDTLSRHHVMDFGFYNSQTGFCVGGIDQWYTLPAGNPCGIIWSTSDGGSSWNLVDSSFSDQLTDILIVHDSLAFAVGFNGQVYRNTNPYQNISSDSEFMIHPLNIYPNPSKSQVTIESPVLIKTAHVEVFNLTGHKIFGSVFQNQRKLVVDTEKLPSGIYLLRIYDDKQFFGGKLIVNH